MKNDLEKFISDNRDKMDTRMPPPGVLGRVLDQLQQQEITKKEGILISFRVLRWAAAAIVLFVVGFTLYKLQKKPDNAIAANPVVKPQSAKTQADAAAKAARQMAQAAPVPSPAKSGDVIDRDMAARKHAFLVSLREQNSRAGREAMFVGLNNMESPATRINAASKVYKLKNIDNDVIDALVQTLNTDPSPNVRLAALDGLAHFYREGYVRRQLIASLKHQQDPSVEIELINLLAKIKESGILTELEKIVNDQNTRQPVRDCAYSGIMELRSS